MEEKTIIQLRKGCERETQYTIEGCNFYGQKFTTKGAYIVKTDEGEPSVFDGVIYFGFGEKDGQQREIFGPYRTEYPTYTEDGKTEVDKFIAKHSLYIGKVINSKGEVVLDNSEFIEAHAEEMKAEFKEETGFGIEFLDKALEDPHSATSVPDYIIDTAEFIGQPTVITNEDGSKSAGITTSALNLTETGVPIVQFADGPGISCGFLGRYCTISTLYQSPAGTQTIFDETPEE